LWFFISGDVSGGWGEWDQSKTVSLYLSKEGTKVKYNSAIKNSDFEF
jgi:hypothetical protein